MNDLKQIIKREYLKCIEDPVHFMRKYCTIQHPQKGKIKFDLYDFQEKTLQNLNKISSIRYIYIISWIFIMDNVISIR